MIIKMISVKERLPTGYIMVDPEVNYREPAEYIVHVEGAEYCTLGMFDGTRFVKDLFTEDAGSFAGPIDYWAEMPKFEVEP